MCVVGADGKAGMPADHPFQVASRIKGLKDSCIHPETGKPYIVSMKGGVDVSIEGLQVRCPVVSLVW